MVHVRVDGSAAGRAAAKIDAAIAQLPAKASKVVAESALQMEAQAKMNIVAVGAVDTGNMLGSVGIIAQSAMSATVAVGAEYGPHVEYGTVHATYSIAPRPFWRRAKETVTPLFRDAAEKLLKDLLA